MKHFPDPIVAKIPERLPNPSYNESELWNDVEKFRKWMIKIEQKNVDDPTDPRFQEFAKSRLSELLSDSDERGRKSLLWRYIHEFSRQLPVNRDRSDSGDSEDAVEAITPLQKDLDAIIRKEYDYDRFIELRRRELELKMLDKQERGELSPQLSRELSEIGEQVYSVILPKLYIEMRRLGYTHKELAR